MTLTTTTILVDPRDPVYQTEYNVDRFDTREAPRRETQFESMPSEIEPGYNKEDSISLFENPDAVFKEKTHPEKGDESVSRRQRLLFDDEDIFRNLAATMRNPNINKHNILDTLADYRIFNSKR